MKTLGQAFGEQSGTVRHQSRKPDSGVGRGIRRADIYHWDRGLKTVHSWEENKRIPEDQHWPLLFSLWHKHDPSWGMTLPKVTMAPSVWTQLLNFHSTPYKCIQSADLHWPQCVGKKMNVFINLFSRLNSSCASLYILNDKKRKIRTHLSNLAD